MGVSLQPRSETNGKATDQHISFSIEIEDDENWFPMDGSTSSYWLDELIEQLQRAKTYCESQKPDIAKNGRQYGWKFKEGGSNVQEEDGR
jgi:hypothetical protein